MLRTIFLYALFISLLTASCGAPIAPEPLKTPTAKASEAGAEWTINMTHSGGIMGLLRSIEISSNGKFTITDERAKKTITGELSADELSKINEQVSSAEYISPSKPDGMSCADCFIYDLKILRDGERIGAQLNDINLTGSGLESLVTYLRGLIDTKLKS